MDSGIELKFMSSSRTSRCSECGAHSVTSVWPKGFKSFDMSVTPGTRHHTLLNSNESPDESEMIFVRSVAEKTETSLAYLDDEIANLREKLKRLEEERAALFRYQTRNNAIVSPLRRMPPEILREIFSSTLPLIGDMRGSDMGQIPWLLTQISSRWRAIAISTSSLWSRIAIDYSYTSSRYSLSLIKAQLDYSQKLKIHFYASGEMDSRPQIDMFKLLSEHSLRWEELSLGLTAEMVPTLVALRDRIPSVRRLWIQWDGEDDQIGVQSIDCFQTASSLVDVAAFNEFRFVPILLPVHQLTRYGADGPLEDHMRILKQTPNLVEARITIDFDEQAWLDVPDTVDLLHLRRLFVSKSEALNYLKVPALEELALDAGGGEDISPSFHSLLDRSSCSLRRLCLISPTAHTTAEILQSSASITELLIFHHDDDRSDEINTLIAALTSPAFAPHLHLIFFACEDENRLDYMAYLEMLQSRRTAETCALTSAALLIEDGTKPEPAIISGLHALRRQGLDLLLLEGFEARQEMNRWDYKTMWILTSPPPAPFMDPIES